MLHHEAVDTPTLELIKSLQDKEYLNGFYLVGGTALAMQLGHRKSIDIDLFSNFSFDTAACTVDPASEKLRLPASNIFPKKICLIPMLDLLVLVPTKPYKSKIGI